MMDDVLDPTIVRFTPKLGGPLIGGCHEDFIPAHDFSLQVTMVDLDEIEARADFQVLLKEPGEVDFSLEVWEQMQAKSPQFTLRNVIRHVMEHHYPHVPWLTEVWRDAEEYAVNFGGEDLLTYEPVDLPDEPEARVIMSEERTANEAVIKALDWHDYHGRWKEGLTANTWYEQHGLVQKKSKGRFAVDDGDKKVVSKPASSGFDASEGEARPTPKPQAAAPEADGRFDGLPDDIKKMLGLI
jgi:hypothetical protein